jgi:hypothetical protein
VGKAADEEDVIISLEEEVTSEHQTGNSNPHFK